jgi:hypothetical protein
MYSINPENVARIAIQTMHDLGHSDFDKVEVVLGLSECIARVVVDSSKTPIEGRDLLEAGLTHIRKVMKAGFSSKGFNND